jgi:ATP synthase protein I
MLEKGVLAMGANDTNDKKEMFSALMTYGTVGLEMGISLAIGLAIGYFLDGRFKTAPVFTIVFMAFGLAAGMKRLYSLWKRVEREDERDDNK